MSSINTYTGKKFDFLEIRQEDICIEDVAHALSLICRFNGHTNEFYSVAEHCVRMARSASLPGPVVWKLMHDAAEAYIGDMVSPLKYGEGMDMFRHQESRIMEVIADKFQLPELTGDMMVDIKEADHIMRVTEQRDLFIGLSPSPDSPDPLPGIIVPWGARIAEASFMDMAQHFLVAGL